VSLFLFRSLGSGNRTFDFDCGIDLNSCGIVMVECCGEFWLGHLPQDLFSPRVFHQLFFYTVMANTVFLGNNEGYCHLTTLVVVWEMVEVT